MTEKSKLIWVYLFSTVFIVINSFLILKEQYWGAALPVLLFIILLYFISIDKVILMIALLTPLAINIQDMDVGLGVSLPTEPLMFGVLIFFLLKLLYDAKYDFTILKHPLTLAILFNLVWILFTSITSELPLVSFKFLVSRLWFVIPFYFILILVFKKYSNIKSFVWLYVLGLLVVIGYTIYQHSLRGFDEDSGHWVMSPFYNDHTAYGAILSMFIPLSLGFVFNKTYSAGTKAISFIVFSILMVALVLSYSRAAWISIGAALIIYFIILLKIKFKYVFLATVLFIGTFFVLQEQIIDSLERNKQDSSANFVEHIQSISNISSDASNLERINRWQSAIRMFRERPFWGWGPGTYQFLYGSYQMSREKTIISTNAGDMGNAHSEYIGPLVESGVIGMLSILVLFSMSIFYGLKVYSKAVNRDIKQISLGVTLGLITYFIHGFLNNFLDSDKASVPVWGFIAIIVALDIYHNKIETKDKVQIENK